MKKRLDGVNPLLIATILFIFFLSISLPTYNYTTGGGDLGEYLNNPVRIVHGELPYQDFWLMFPPGEVYLPALLYAIFGINVNVALAALVIMAALVGLFAFVLGRLVFNDNTLSAIAAVLIFLNGFTAAYFLFLLIAACFLVRFLRNKGKANALLMGAFAGLAFMFRFHESGAALLAFVVAAAAYLRLNGNTWRDILKDCAAMCIGAFAVPFALTLPLVKIWPQMLYQVTIGTIIQGSTMRLPYFPPVRPYLGEMSAGIGGFIGSGNVDYLFNALLRLLDLSYLYALYLSPFIVVAAALYFLISPKSDSGEKAIILLFVLWGVFTFPKTIWRADLPHLAQSIGPMFFALLYMLQKGARTNGVQRVSRYIALGLALIALTILLHDALYIKDITSYIVGPHPQYPVSTKYGSIVQLNEADADNIRGLIGYVDNHTREGDYIFVTPWDAPPLYALTGRKNPTYYDSLVDPVVRPSVEKQELICDELLSRDTRLVVHYPDWGFDTKEKQFSYACPLVEKCIEDNFIQTASVGPYKIYVPKANESAG